MGLLYKYGNFPVTLLLVIHAVYILLGIAQNTFMIFPLLIYIILLYLVNRHYLKTYKMFPFTIDIDNEKMICSDFMMGEKVEIMLSKISKIEGSIFGGNPVKPLYVFDEENGTKIGIYSSMKDFDKLLTIILSNVKKELYEELVEKVKAPKAKRKK
ncbi:MAG: hypothetical protein ACEPO8_03955 [Rhodothermaceae bacterium]